MPDTTLATPPVLGSGDGKPSPTGASGAGDQTFLRRRVWWIVGVAVVVFSVLIVRWTNTRPGYDPYGWLIWGYQTLHLSLDLGGAPSWKPLPLLFTVPYSLFGHFALWLWMVTCVAASFAGTIFAGRIAYRIVAAGGRYRNAAIAAALFAGFGMYGIQDNINGTLDSYMHYVLSVQSDPMIVTMILAAIDFHMTRHRRWVVAMLVLASLGRPEVWPFLGLYCLWCWRTAPEMRLYVVISVIVVAFLWFGVPTITNGRPLVAGDLAQGSPRELHQNKIIGTVDRFKTLNLWPVWLLALAAVGWAGYRWRRGRYRLTGTAAPDGVAAPVEAAAPGGVAAPDEAAAPSGATAAPGSAAPDEREVRNDLLLVLALAAGVLVWLVIEVAFALHGWPAVPRYVFEPAVVAIVLGGIGFGWLLREIPQRLKVPTWSGVVVAGLLGLALVPGAISRIRNEHKDIRHERVRTTQISRLSAMISHLGGHSAVLRCGRPVANVEYVSILGWLTDQNDGKIGHRPQFELHQHYPIVFFTQLPNGWATYPWHTAASRVSSCQNMKALYVFTGRHPNGVFAPNPVAPKPSPPIPNTSTPG